MYPLDAAATARWPWLLSVQALTSFDAVNRRIPPGATDIFALPPHALTIKLVGPPAGGMQNITISPAALRLGDTVIARHVVYGATGVEAHFTDGLAVTDVALLAVAGMGVYTNHVRDVAVTRLTLERRGGRPMSINADGVHILNARGGAVTVRDCVLEGQGDDGLNVATAYVDVEAMHDARTLRLGRWGAVYSAGLLPLAANDSLVFLERATMSPRGAARVAAVAANGTVHLAEDAPAGAGVYDLVFSREAIADWVLVEGNTFSQNRARGALLKQPNLLARDNFFNWTSGPAAQAIPDGCQWFEGVALANWSFTGNAIVGGDYGGDAQSATLFVAASTPTFVNGSVPSDHACLALTSQPLHASLLVADNTFTVGAGRAAFAVAAADGVAVRNNTVLYEGAPPSADFVGVGVIGGVAEGNICPGRAGSACIATGFSLPSPPLPLSRSPPKPQYVYVEAADPEALCLDGSRFGAFLCKAASNTSWEIAVQGGGFAYALRDAGERALTPLGSSRTWPADASKLSCLDSGTNYVYLQYCDGAAFSGYRAQAQGPTGVANASFVYMRGARNLDAALAIAHAAGLGADTRSVTFTGASAGGVTVIHRLDAVAAFVAAVAPLARVVGKPTCGYFIDSNATFSAMLAGVFDLHNASGAVSAACQAAQPPRGLPPARCFIPSVAAPFTRTGMFLMQSRFDLWQLADGELNIPCMRRQPFAPPFPPSSCTAAEDAQIAAYGPSFMSFFDDFMNATSDRNGAFVDACIIHGSTNSSIDGASGEAAFLQWAAGGGGRSWWLMRCGAENSTSAGPCDTSPVCVPYP